MPALGEGVDFKNYSRIRHITFSDFSVLKFGDACYTQKLTINFFQGHVRHHIRDRMKESKIYLYSKLPNVKETLLFHTATEK